MERKTGDNRWHLRNIGHDVPAQSTDTAWRRAHTSHAADCGPTACVSLRELSVLGRTLQGMGQIRDAAGWVDSLDDAAVAATDTMLKGGYGVGPPTVHALIEVLSPAYVGYLRCRPVLRGHDAHAAVAVMGLFGSMLGASRLVVTYEHADMATAWQDPAADRAPTGVVVIDAGPNAGPGGHTVRWHPVQWTDAPDAARGGPLLSTRWGTPSRHPGGRLPAAVEQLLAVWREPREWSDVDFLGVYAGWEQGGYDVRWVQRPAKEQHQPGWMRLLAPVM